MDLTRQSELNLLTGFLGVPGYIISTFLPSIQQIAARQPKLVKALCIFVAFTTVGFSLLERIKRTLMSFLVSYFMFSTTIEAHDPLYQYVLRWLQNHKKFLPEQELQARSKEDMERMGLALSSAPLPPRLNAKDIKNDVIYDFNGLQIFWHNWRPLFVSPFPANRIGPPSYLTVRCFGFSSQPLREIIDEAWKVHRKNDHTHLTAVYRPTARSGGWKCVARRNRRSLNTMILNPKEKMDLLDDIKFYLSGEAKAWYTVRGIPYRRGYLFHGRPGTGKTSLSMAIAGEFGLDIYIVSLLDPQINDTFLHTFFTNLPKGALILLEDIDSAGLARETFEKSLQSYRSGGRYRSTRATASTRVTLSGLLNAIDGADSPEGHLLIMTTNVPDALDEALIRPGRIDYKIGFRAISPPQARSIFFRMYEGDVDEKFDLYSMAETIGNTIPDDVFTPAELQGHLLRFKRKPQEALDHLEEWMTGILDERNKLEEAKKKEHERLEKREKRRKAKRKGMKPSVAAAESDSDSSSASAYIDARPEIVYNGYLDSGDYYQELNGDPIHADQSTGLQTQVDESLAYMSHTRAQLSQRRATKPRSPNWDDLNGRERTCLVM